MEAIKAASIHTMTQSEQLPLSSLMFHGEIVGFWVIDYLLYFEDVKC